MKYRFDVNLVENIFVVLDARWHEHTLILQNPFFEFRGPPKIDFSYNRFTFALL